MISLFWVLPLLTIAQSEEKAIEEAARQFSQFYMDGNIPALAMCYTEDGKIMPPNAGIIEGREAIQKRWTLPEGVKILYHKTISVDLEILGETAYDAGTYEGTTQRADGSESSWDGKYIIIWKKLDGEWKIYWDIWNRS